MACYILPMNFSLRKKFVWPFMQRDISKWSKIRLDCQASKLDRHTITNPSHFVPLSARFSHIHMDLIGPLGLSDGSQYCLTIIDIFTRWPEAIPIRNKSSESVCLGFYDNWITRYGDQKKEFESRMTQNLMKFTDCHRIRAIS